MMGLCMANGLGASAAANLALSGSNLRGRGPDQRMRSDGDEGGGQHGVGSQGVHWKGCMPSTKTTRPSQHHYNHPRDWARTERDMDLSEHWPAVLSMAIAIR